ncbi:hypothetical protein PG988_011000 [Apiospora saccharicola]
MARFLVPPKLKGPIQLYPTPGTGDVPTFQLARPTTSSSSSASSSLSSSCTSIAAETVTTTARPFFGIVCKKRKQRRYVCPQPTSTCRPGEPTQKPYPSETVTEDCTPTVVVHLMCGCPSCTPATTTAAATSTGPIVTAAQSLSSSTYMVASPITAAS